MSIVLSILKIEIETDPEAIGYENGLNARSDQHDADEINKRSNGPTVGDVITGAQLFGACRLSESRALSDGDRAELGGLFAADAIDLSDQNIRGKLRGNNGFFAPGSTSADRINAFTRKITRAEELFGEGVRVTASNVADARALP